MNRREVVAAAGGALAGVAAGMATRAWPGPAATANGLPEFSRLSFAQQGEDLILFHALRDQLKVEHPTYLDVGAAHPRRSNNTYLLYWTGASGVLVEPNPMFVKMLREQRPRDKVLPVGIGITDTAEADYYEIKVKPELNTFSSEQAAMLQQNGNVLERVSKMPLVNINKAIAENLGKAPDLLSTDIEGLDEAIIRTLDLSRFQPGVICAEDVAIGNDGGLSELAKNLKANGYVIRGGSMINSVFIEASRIAPRA